MESAWQDIVVPPDMPLGEALRVLDAGGARLLMVADQERRLLGTVTDGDVRRALLHQVVLTSPVSLAMNATPRVGRPSESVKSRRSLMQQHSLLHLPIVDANGCIVGLDRLLSQSYQPDNEAWVFLMAGGFGNRLRPLTEDCPKPMLKVAGKPILETILERFVAAKFRRFFISVHYLPEQIKSHFGDGSRWGSTIRYIEEETPLGTCGALGLLPDLGGQPLFVMNGDVLTSLDFNALLDYHVAQSADLTACVREYDIQVPFGVVQSAAGRITGVVEKPVHRFFVMAGIYVVSSGIVAGMRPARRFDMPELIDSMIQKGSNVSAFPMHEQWSML